MKTEQEPLLDFITYLNIKHTDNWSVCPIIKTPNMLFAEAIQYLKGQNVIKQLFNKWLKVKSLPWNPIDKVTSR